MTNRIHTLSVYLYYTLAFLLKFHKSGYMKSFVARLFKFVYDSSWLGRMCCSLLVFKLVCEVEVCLGLPEKISLLAAPLKRHLLV